MKTSETADSGWKGLYRVGGTAALLMAVFIPIQFIIFVALPPPSTAIGWFTLFQNNRLLGLLDMDLSASVVAATYWSLRESISKAAVDAK